MDRGFTLLEVLIAVAILSIALLSLINAESQGIEMAMRSRFMTTSTLLAQKRIADVTSGIESFSTGSDQGDFGEDFPGYVYTEEIEQTPLTGYFKYTLTVRWGSQESTYETKIMSFLSKR
ncbi:MAG: type IV pilus modification PilV family protein [Desulfomonilia bacterium]